jgi:hypothetical protein
LGSDVCVGVVGYGLVEKIVWRWRGKVLASVDNDVGVGVVWFRPRSVDVGDGVVGFRPRLCSDVGVGVVGYGL